MVVSAISPVLGVVPLRTDRDLDSSVAVEVSEQGTGASEKIAAAAEGADGQAVDSVRNFFV